MIKKVFIIIFFIFLTSCFNFRMNENQDISISSLGMDSLIIEKIKSNEFYGISLSTKFNNYELKNISNIYITGFYPSEVLEKYGGCQSFNYELKKENNGINLEYIHTLIANDLDEQDISDIIQLMKNIKIELYVDGEIVDSKYLEIQYNGR